MCATHARTLLELTFLWLNRDSKMLKKLILCRFGLTHSLNLVWEGREKCIRSYQNFQNKDGNLSELCLADLVTRFVELIRQSLTSIVLVFVFFLCLRLSHNVRENILLHVKNDAILSYTIHRCVCMPSVPQMKPIPLATPNTKSRSSFDGTAQYVSPEILTSKPSTFR